MAQIYRYSNLGFEPQFQHHLFKKSKTTLSDLMPKCGTDFAKSLVSLAFQPADPDFEYSGIFAFLKEPSIADRDYYLNHLNKMFNKDNIKLFHHNINDKSICYLDNDFVFSLKNRTTIKKALEAGYETIYIPESQLINLHT